MQRSPGQLDQPLRPTARSISTLRGGFTLIELIVVILVIGILMAILLPAINNVRIRAQEARVVADIKNLDAALAAFKLKYGTEPPSSFRLYENGTWSMSNDLDRNSVAIVRQLWPTYVLTQSGTNMVAGIPPGDLNNDGSATVYTLNGAECLAFFLGGPGLMNVGGSSSIPVPQTVAASGFSSNPLNPFAAGGTRVGPFVEIDASRLSDVNGNGAYELLDPFPNQTMPYQYFSSYNGRGYQPFGYDGTTSMNDDEVIVISGARTMSSVYLKTDTAALTNSPSGGAWNVKTYQIISPGQDSAYGMGGLFTIPGSNTAGSGLGISVGNTYRDFSYRQPELDNITNFSAGSMNKTFTPTGW